MLFQEFEKAIGLVLIEIRDIPCKPCHPPLMFSAITIAEDSTIHQGYFRDLGKGGYLKGHRSGMNGPRRRGQERLDEFRSINLWLDLPFLGRCLLWRPLWPRSKCDPSCRRGRIPVPEEDNQEKTSDTKCDSTTEKRQDADSLAVLVVSLAATAIEGNYHREKRLLVAPLIGKVGYGVEHDGVLSLPLFLWR